MAEKRAHLDLVIMAKGQGGWGGAHLGPVIMTGGVIQTL